MNFVKRLQRNLGDYLLRPAAGRRELRHVINDISEKLPETVIFGGMIREFALGNARKFISDIDLVSYGTQAEIYPAISGYQPILNKFGGYRFIVNKQRFDIWSLQDTWAFRNGYVSGSTFPDLLRTTFFNLDGAYYDVLKGELVLLPNYEYNVKNRVLDINLLPNPSPQNMAHKAIVLALNKQLGTTQMLTQFIINNLTRGEMSWLEEKFIDNAKKFLSQGETQIYRFHSQGQLNA